MPLTIGTNIASLSAQRRLAEGTAKLAKTFERLSSGMRINTAADDAAGLSITESLRADQRVFRQGVRNFNDGISLLNIADSAIESLSGIVTRLKELAEQSANGTYSYNQRKALDKEAQALSKEYTRIALTTSFNGVKLLDGGLGGGLRLQGGYGTNGGISAGVGGAIGTGTFTTSTSISTGIASAVIAAGGDFNGDGFDDFATASTTTGQLTVQLGSAGGISSSFTTYSGLAGGVYDLTSGDINGDGILDLVAVGYSSSSVGIRLGTGDGTFGSLTTVSIQGQGGAVALGDMDNDGDLDIVVGTGFGSTKIEVLKNSGGGTFTSVGTFAGAGIVSGLGLADLNNDGFLDVYTSSVSGAITLVNNGTGSLSLGTFIAGGVLNAITHGDFNQDGNIDIALGDTAGGVLRTYLGNGTGSFTAISTTPDSTAGFIRDLATGDFNGDGILDLASADYNLGASTFSVFLGNGNGSFATVVTYSGPSTTGGIAVGDFNGDGVADILQAAHNAMGYSYGNREDGAGPLLAFSLIDIGSARQALMKFDLRLQQLAAQRGVIGANLARIQVGVNNLQSTSDAYAFAESRIRDADIAQESSDLVRLNILQQAASSVLAQANLQPSLALRLLQTED